MITNQRVCIREFGFLVEGNQTSGNSVGISKSAFKFLLSLIQDETDSTAFNNFLRLTTYKRQTAIKVLNYVGVIQTPCGTSIEILPKIYLGEENQLEKTRYQLIKMLRCLRNSPFKHAKSADILSTKMPLLEIYISHFLAITNQLIKRGIRSDYIREQKNAPFLKGRLQVNVQIRKNSLHPERFAIECDEYLVNRPANRLIKSTLELAGKASWSPKNQRLAKELLFAFEDVPKSYDTNTDFQKVKLTRGMSYYEEVLKWAKLLLNGQGPTSSAGNVNTLSLLYPMERIFEDYVAHCLRRNISTYYGEGSQIKTQAATYSLVENHAGSRMFRLKPDLLVTRSQKPICVMDTKWKMIDAADKNNKYGISQADMYQLYAYGHKYLKSSETKSLMLIYPRTERFQQPLPTFTYEDGLELQVVPFDLDTGDLLIEHLH